MTNLKLRTSAKAIAAGIIAAPVVVVSIGLTLQDTELLYEGQDCNVNETSAGTQTDCCSMSWGFTRIFDEDPSNLNNTECVNADGLTFETGIIGFIYDANMCADACVNVPSESTYDKLVGFNLSCEKARCYCLYNAPLTESEQEAFERVDPGDSATGVVGGTSYKPAYSCYAVTTRASSISYSNDDQPEFAVD